MGFKTSKELRKKAEELYKGGMTQGQVAIELGMNIMTVGNYLRKMPDFEKYKKTATRYSSYDKFLEIEDQDLSISQIAENLVCSKNLVYAYRHRLKERRSLKCV